jgi:hypothetical protein
VFGKSWRETARHVAQSIICGSLILALTSCAQPKAAAKTPPTPMVNRSAVVEEVSPPESIQRLSNAMAEYHPQIKIVGVKPDTTLEENSVTVQFDIDDFPIYKDPGLGLGPHLHVFLDDQPYQAIYDAKQKVTFKDLSPGTHTIRAFASRPWHESFKTTGAFATLTFNVLVPTQANRPEPAQPLLTYSRPQGEYGAEPIMLDYYLVPLQNSQGDEQRSTTSPPQVRVTINGNSFITSEETPLYLKGFKSGQNWVKLELLDANGKPIPNAFSESVRLFTLKANGQDTLSKLVRGELSAQDAASIVDRDVSERKATERLEAEREASRREATQRLETAKREAAEREAAERKAAERKAIESEPVVPVVPVPTHVSPSPAVMATPTPAVRPKVLPTPQVTITPNPRPTIQVSPSPIIKAKPQASEAPVQPSERVPTSETLNSQSSSTGTAASKAAPFWSKFKPDEFLKGLKTESAEKPAAPTATIPPVTSTVLTERARPTVSPTPPVIRRFATPSPSPSTALSPKAVPSIAPIQLQTESANSDALKLPVSDWRKFLQFPQQQAQQTPTVRPTEAPQLPERYLKKMQEAEQLSQKETISNTGMRPAP